MARTRHRRYKKLRKTRKIRGGGESCYGKNGRTWSCSAACGENGACQTYD